MTSPPGLNKGARPGAYRRGVPVHALSDGLGIQPGTALDTFLTQRVGSAWTVWFRTIHWTRLSRHAARARGIRS